MKRVTLNTREGCHLCDVVRGTIDEVGRRRRFALEVVDILGDPGAYEKYKHEVPVVLVEGVEVARHRMDRKTLEVALAGGG